MSGYGLELVHTDLYLLSICITSTFGDYITPSPNSKVPTTIFMETKTSIFLRAKQEA